MQKIFRIRRDHRLTENNDERKRIKEEIDFMEQEHKKKKADEVSQVEKDDLEKLRKELTGVENARKDILESYGAANKVVKQLIDLALLANNMLRGEELSTFVKTKRGSSLVSWHLLCGTLCSSVFLFDSS